MMDTLFECQGLTKSYKRVRALDDLSLHLPAGETIGLVGPNGAGKTTLFSLISGFIKPDKGTMQVLGQSADTTDLKGQIGILPQDAPFLKGIAVESQLMLFARLQGLSKQQARSETRRVLTDFEVQDLARQKPENLSHGQRKRVALAQAMIGQPRLVLLDEPTAGLDPVAADDVRRLFRRQARQSTLIISSHNLYELEDICKTIVVIDHGKLVTCSSIADLVGQDENLTVIVNTPISDDLCRQLQGLDGIKSVKPDPDDPRRVTIQFSAGEVNQLQMRILNLLQEAGLNVVELTRGKALADRLARLLRGELDPETQQD